MTVTREELLRAAYAGKDDTELLVYADWLEQHGQVARAQVIHLQCELARTPKHARRRLELEWELEAVLAELGDSWIDELPVLDGVEWIELSRGLPSAVRVRDIETLETTAAAIIAAAPTVTTVEIEDLEGHDEIVDLPWLRTLRVRGEMGSGPLLAIPTELDIDVGEYNDIQLDFERDDGRPLERLAIRNNTEVGEELATTLAESEWAAGLTSLHIPTHWVDDNTGYGPAVDPRVGDDGGRALTRLAKLETLTIDRQLAGKVLEKIFAMPALRDLQARECAGRGLDFTKAKGAKYERLDLGRSPLHRAGAEMLAKSPRLSELQRLELDTCELDASAIAELVKSPMWSTLRHLDISRNPLGIGGIRVLAEAAAPANLHTLRIADADLDEAAGTALGKIGWLSQLAVLDISGNPFGRGCASLRSIEADHLRELVISATGLQRTEAAALSRFWPKLVHLDLSNNLLTDAGLERFATTKEASALQTLRLRDCNLGNDGLELLAQRGRCPRLRVLDLHHNKFDPPALEALLRAPVVARLEVLDLSSCALTADTAAMLATTPMPPRLRRLNLRGNVFHEPTFLVLAESPTLRAVPEIKLSGNPWGFEASVRERLAARFGAGWYQDD